MTPEKRELLRQCESIVRTYESDAEDDITRREYALAYSVRQFLTRPEAQGETPVIEAAKGMDWQQVVLNGGPPCFHLEGGKFCGRAERWAGHGDLHPYLSLAGLLERELSAKQPQAGAVDVMIQCGVCHRIGKSMEEIDHIDGCSARPFQSRPSSEREGFVLVPVEPTSEMLRAAGDEDCRNWDQIMSPHHYAALYKAMIDATKEGQ